MQAVRLRHAAPIDNNPLHIEHLPMPEPGRGQVLLRNLFCGVCHTDLHIAEGDIHPPSLPITPGHQVVSRIDRLGEDVHGLSLHQRVGVPWLYSADGNCEFCRRGRENLCPQARFTGFHVDGGFAEYMLAEAEYVLPIPENISDIQAAPLLCAGIIGYRSLKQADIQNGDHLGLIGFGASAHLTIQVAKYWKCEVSVFTRSEEHKAHARQLGAYWVGEATEAPPRSLDKAIIFAPSGKLVPVILEKLRPGGTLAINAIHMSPIPEMDYRVIYGERTLRSVANATYQDGIEFLQLAGEIPLQATTQLYPFTESNRALQDIKYSRLNGEAVLQIGA